MKNQDTIQYDSTTKKVLVVDDDVHIRELLSLFLQKAGFHVVHATNGAEACEILQTASDAPIDVIIVDLMMPVLDGIAFLRWFRNEMKQSTPVLVLSGVSATNTRNDAYAAGATRLLLKPVRPQEIVTHVQQMLAGDEPPVS